jgi:hypothetical protein
VLSGVEALGPEHGHQRQRDQEAAEREKVRDPADGFLVLLGNEQEYQSADQRREEDDREYMVLHEKLLAFSS